MTIHALRTPDARFDALVDWPYQPRYFEDLAGYDGLRMHYIDEGPKDANVTFLCLHGNPSWIYLFRHMIPVFLEAGHRVVAPDMFGFGRSDKPAADETHQYHWHRDSLKAFVERMALSNVCLVCQDWGGIFGLTLPMDYPEIFTRMIVMNTDLPVGQGESEGFAGWRAFSNSRDDLVLPPLFMRGKADLSAEEAAGYEAPYPDATYKAAIRRFPNLVMYEPDMEGIDINQRALKWFSTQWRGDAFMAHGAADPVMNKSVMDNLHAQIKGCRPIMTIPDGGHFLQEWGAPIAQQALKEFNLPLLGDKAKQ